MNFIVKLLTLQMNFIVSQMNNRLLLRKVPIHPIHWMRLKLILVNLVKVTSAKRKIILIKVILVILVAYNPGMTNKNSVKSEIYKILKS